MGRITLCCSDCNKALSLETTCAKISGYQRSEVYIGKYRLWKCKTCGNRYWDFVND